MHRKDSYYDCYSLFKRIRENIKIGFNIIFDIYLFLKCKQLIVEFLHKIYRKQRRENKLIPANCLLSNILNIKPSPMRMLWLQDWYIFVKPSSSNVPMKYWTVTHFFLMLKDIADKFLNVDVWRSVAVSSISIWKLWTLFF